MRKILISGATALTFGLSAFFVIPRESSAQIIQPPCRCAPGTQEVFKVTRNLLTGVVYSRVFLGCMTSAEIGALPPIPITNPTAAQSYELGCGSRVFAQ